MLKTPQLSERQISDFFRDGFVVFRRAFDAAEIERIEKWTRELAAKPEEVGKQWVFHEESHKEPGKDLICRIENITPFHPGFAELSETLKAPVGQLLGEKAMLFKEKIISI